MKKFETPVIEKIVLVAEEITNVGVEENSGASSDGED